VVAGSNTVLGEGLTMASEWKELFQQQKSWQTRIPLIGTIQRTVNVDIRGVGSEAGFQEAIEGKVHLLAASEPMPAESYKAITGAGYHIDCAAEIGYDVVTFVTDINNTIPAISTRDMASILNGSITDWSQVGGEPQPIRILAREGSGTTSLILERYTGDPAFRPYFIECKNNDECLDKALSMPGSLYWVGSAWLKTQPPRYLRLILVRRGDLAPEDPLKEDFDPDKYPEKLIRPLYMYVLSGNNLEPGPTALAKEFLHLVRGVHGQEILENNNFYTYFDPPADVEVEHLPGFGPGPDGLPVVCIQ
jgi:phosphate transport system substrate-binding protein